MTAHLSTSVRTLVWVSLLTSLAAPVWAQQRPLTIEQIFDPTQRVDFDGDSPRGLVWIDNDHYLKTERSDRSTRSLMKVAHTCLRSKMYSLGGRGTAVRPASLREKK